MKKKIFIGLAVLFVALIGVILYGALVVSKKSPVKTTMYSDQGLDIKVMYCLPFL